MRSIESLSIAELASVSKKIIPQYKLTLDGGKTFVDVDEEIHGLFDVVDEISEYYR